MKAYAVPVPQAVLRRTDREAALPSQGRGAGEHSRVTGPALLVSNHLAFCDSIFLPVAVPRQIVFPAKSEYFTAPGLKGRLVATFFRSVGQIPIDRSGGRASLAALNTGLEILQKGELFGIYPEGTRSPDGRLYKGKTGVARMAIVAGVPVIPVAMIDTEKLQPARHGLAAVADPRARPPAAAPGPPGRRRSASRWTSPATRGWSATGSCCARSRTRSCTR